MGIGAGMGVRGSGWEIPPCQNKQISTSNRFQIHRFHVVIVVDEVEHVSASHRFVALSYLRVYRTRSRYELFEVVFQCRIQLPQTPNMTVHERKVQ